MVICVCFNAIKSEFTEVIIYESFLKSYKDLKYYKEVEVDEKVKIVEDKKLINEVESYVKIDKYEFGKVGDQIILIDEIHTPDSSRYFYAEGYEQRQENREPQPQLSKEFVREWLIAHGFQGLDGQKMPDMPDDFVWEISDRYIQLYEIITGQPFVKADVANIEKRIVENVEAYFIL